MLMILITIIFLKNLTYQVLSSSEIFKKNYRYEIFKKNVEQDGLGIS